LGLIVSKLQKLFLTDDIGSLDQLMEDSEVTVVRDLTIKQRKFEQEKLVEVKQKNLTRTADER
jgi:hypothetical protein